MADLTGRRHLRKLEKSTVKIQPVLSTDSAAHFDLGVDRLATPSEIADMSDPWLGVSGSAMPDAMGNPAEFLPLDNPSAEMSLWVGRLQLPGV